MWYLDNGLSRYDGKEYIESVSKLRRYNTASGPLEAGETFTIKTKLRVWKAILVSPEYHPPPKRRRVAATEVRTP